MSQIGSETFHTENFFHTFLNYLFPSSKTKSVVETKKWYCIMGNVRIYSNLHMDHILSSRKCSGIHLTEKLMPLFYHIGM